MICITIVIMKTVNFSLHFVWVGGNRENRRKWHNCTSSHIWKQYRRMQGRKRAGPFSLHFNKQPSNVRDIYKENEAPTFSTLPFPCPSLPPFSFPFPSFLYSYPKQAIRDSSLESIDKIYKLHKSYAMCSNRTVVEYVSPRLSYMHACLQAKNLMISS